MVAHGEVVLTFVALLEVVDVLLNDRRVLAVGHQKDGGAAEQITENPLIVHQHTARAAAHEHFHAGHTLGVKLADQIEVARRGAEIEGIVHTAFLRA